MKLAFLSYQLANTLFALIEKLNQCSPLSIFFSFSHESLLSMIPDLAA